jgi:hypothetical protein
MHARRTLYSVFVALGILCQEFGLSASDTTNCVPVVILEDGPRFLTVLENCSARFSVTVTGSSPLVYQWYRNGQPVPNATNNIFTMTHVSAADSGTRIYATVANTCSQTVSSEGMVLVSLDVVPPRLLRARGDASLEHVIVTFTTGGCENGPGLDPTSAEDPFSYKLSDGVVVSDARLEPNGTNVVLTTSRQRPNWIYRLQVEGVADLQGNLIAPWSEATLQSWVVSPGPDAKVVPPPLTFVREGNVMWITWPYGSFLQSANDLGGGWQTLLDVDFPYRVTTDDSARFFRAFFDP